MAVRIRKPCGDDALALSRSLRQADLDELSLMTDLDPLGAILFSMEQTLFKHLWCAEDDGALLCIGGCTIDAAPWMLASDNLKKYPSLLTKQSIKMIGEFHRDFEILTNCVDARNIDSVRWLCRLGFTIEPTNDPRILRFTKCRTKLEI